MMNLLGSATDFLKGVVQKRVRTYDSSKNEIYVSGLRLDGVVSATLSDNVKTNGEIGVDKQYYAITETFVARTLTVNLLPTSMCYEQLVTLDFMSQQERARLPIYVYENGSVVGIFSGHIMSLGDTTLSREATSKTVIFGVTTVNMLDTNIVTEFSAADLENEMPFTPVAIDLE